MTVRIVTDSTADLEPEETRSLGIEVVPLMVHFGNEALRDGLDITAGQFYSRLLKAGSPPHTSAPPPGAFVQAFEAAAKAADEIFCVTISSRLSGTLNSAQTAREQWREPSRITIFDSLAVTAAEANIVLAAAAAARAGEGIEGVQSAATQARDNQEILVGLETLEYLQRGGRIGRARAFLGGLLSVKPLITLRDGEVAPAERVRSRARMLSRIEEFALSFEDPEFISIAHADAPEDAERLAERLRGAYPATPAIACRWFGPVVGLYTGPGAVGVAVVRRYAK